MELTHNCTGHVFASWQNSLLREGEYCKRGERPGGQGTSQLMNKGQSGDLMKNTVKQLLNARYCGREQPAMTGLGSTHQRA